ncbi:MAG: DinB family protein [Spirochaetota bacterium]
MTDPAYIRTALAAQLGAALDTLVYCVEQCPEDQWQESHGDYPFSQVVFHTLFFCDFYLSGSMSDFKNQAYHTDRPGFFGDYEELENRKPCKLYKRGDIVEYLGFCKAKAYSFLVASSDGQLYATAHHKKGTMSVLELVVYLTRHIQHHAAQLGLRLQLLDGNEMPWFSKGTPPGHGI